ncbi:MAG: cell wall synthase accessory phosphoprotein MacP [Enterococcus sp.]
MTGPLLTRSQLRRLKEEQTAKENSIEEQAEKDYQVAEESIDNFYRKAIKKNKPVMKTRTGEKRKSQAVNRFLWQSIVIVSLLLIGVILAIIFW